MPPSPKLRVNRIVSAATFFGCRWKINPDIGEWCRRIFVVMYGQDVFKINIKY